MNGWTTYTAMAFIRDVIVTAHCHGWQLGLHGSVLTYGASDHDLDLVAFPMNASADGTHTLAVLHKLMEDSGAKLLVDAGTVHMDWRSKGCTDMKHCEVWEHFGRRIDLFVLGLKEGDKG